MGRGGGSPVSRALAALPPGTVNGRIKITEQGEIVSQQFGLLPVAERTLEVTLAGVLMQQFSRGPEDPTPAEMGEFRATMSDLAERGLALYRELTQDDDALFRMFRSVTPIDALADARFGSRPAYRPGGKAGIEGIRAIPWVFGWTQIRLTLPGWLGVGTALGHYVSTAAGLDRLRRMARRWPFFDDLLSKIENGVREVGSGDRATLRRDARRRRAAVRASGSGIRRDGRRRAADQTERCADARHAGDPVGDHAAEPVRGSLVAHPGCNATATSRESRG